MLQAPQSFVVSQECRKAAWQNGYRRELGEAAGWLRFESTTAPGGVFLAASSGGGRWYLAVEHVGAGDELGLADAGLAGPGYRRFVLDDLSALYDALSRTYSLSISLPNVPLQTFQHKTRHLPQTTEAERLVVQRIGQDVFRAGLMEYWRERCPLTGITDRALLKASHIIPWSDCSTDAERLDVHNGLLLSALWDAAFDRGLVTFDDDGQPLFSKHLSEPARTQLAWTAPIRLTEQHRERLRWHRTALFERNDQELIAPSAFLGSDTGGLPLTGGEG